jgi:hypothetical protein
MTKSPLTGTYCKKEMCATCTVRNNSNVQNVLCVRFTVGNTLILQYVLCTTCVCSLCAVFNMYCA